MLPYILVIFIIFSSIKAQDTKITISLDKTLTDNDKELYSSFMNITALSTVTFNFINVNKNVSFIIFQAHSHLYNITMYNNTYEHGSFKTGTNVGLYSPVSPFYALYLVNPNEQNLKILIAVHGYEDQAPVPGGCSMESVPIAPYLMTQVSPNKDYILLDAAAARDSPGSTCEYANSVNMIFYRLYLPERDFSIDTYFAGIYTMMNLNSIKDHGEIIPQAGYKHLLRTLSAYPGTGSVYVAVAETLSFYNESKTVLFSDYSVYVPIVTYACSPLVEYDCELLDDLLSKILCASLLFVGLFVCYFGHRFFKTEMFIFGMLSGVIVTYILISLITEIEHAPLLGASFLSGILFGFIWLTFWWFYGIPVFSVLLCTLNFGFFTACVLYHQMPGGLVMISQDQSFWTIFILMMLIASLTLASATYPANILCCAVLGAYAVVYPIDYCLGSNLKYILINTVRRATVANFDLAVLSAPFEKYDALLVLVWVMLATTGFLFQHYHNRGKPPFPPPPQNIRERPDVYNYGTRDGPRTYSRVDTVSDPVSTTRPIRNPNERTALLA